MTWQNAHQVDLAKTFGGSQNGEESSGGGAMTRTVPRSFELAFDGLYRLAYRVAFRILGDRSDAEDVAQEALARAALRWSRLHERPEGWVCRVATNQAIDRYRRRRRRPQIPAGPVGIVDERLGERGDLVVALRKLPRRRARSRRPSLSGRFLGGRCRRCPRVLGRRGEVPGFAGALRAARSPRRSHGQGWGRCSSILTIPPRRSTRVPVSWPWSADGPNRSARGGAGRSWWGSVASFSPPRSASSWRGPRSRTPRHRVRSTSSTS